MDFKELMFYLGVLLFLPLAAGGLSYYLLINDYNLIVVTLLWSGVSICSVSGIFIYRKYFSTYEP